MMRVTALTILWMFFDLEIERGDFASHSCDVEPRRNSVSVQGVKFTVPSASDVADTVCVASTGVGGHRPCAGQAGVHRFRVS